MNPHYRRAMEHISLSPEAKAHIKARLTQPERHRIAPRRWAAVAAAAVLACALTITANAESIEAFFRQLNPTLAASLVPVGQSCTDQGLTLTVESATVKDGWVHVYFLVQNDGDSGVMKKNIYSFQMNNPDSPFAGWRYEFLGYDPQNDAWRVLFTMDEKDLPEQSDSDGSRRFTLSIDEMLVDQGFTSVDLTPDWQALPIEPKTVEVQANIWNYVEGESWSFVDGVSSPAQCAVLQEKHIARVLVPGGSEIPAVDAYTISAIGFLDDGLHIQLRHETNDFWDNEHLNLFHPDAEEPVSESYVSFKGNDGMDYEEHIFDISPEEIDGWGLKGYFATGGKTVKGNWTVTFNLDEQDETAKQG